jgi:DNA-binding NarL/FixJ family response regulator
MSQRVLICVHHRRRRAALEYVLSEHPDLEVGVVESCADLLSGDPGDALVVIDPPDDIEPARLVTDLVRRSPGANVVLLRDPDDTQAFEDCLMAGAAGFCDPAAGPDAVVRTIEAVRSEGVAIPRHLVRPLVDALRNGRRHVVETPNGPVSLTRREWEVLLLVRQRRSTTEIADRLFVSKTTVRTHVSTVLHKLGLSSRSEAIACWETDAARKAWDVQLSGRP